MLRGSLNDYYCHRVLKIIQTKISDTKNNRLLYLYILRPVLLYLSDQSYKIRGTFYKYWASLPIYTSNHHLTDLIENSDPLSIKTAPIGKRKLIGLLYSDALHNKLCCTTKCFRQPKPTKRVPNPPTCICKLCGDNLSLLHPTTCTAFPPNTPPMERIKTLWFNSYSLIPMI